MKPIERVARAIADNLQGVTPDQCHYAAVAAIQALIPVGDEMGEAAINHIIGEQG